jgi:hypothetical protein
VGSAHNSVSIFQIKTPTDRVTDNFKRILFWFWKVQQAVKFKAHILDFIPRGNCFEFRSVCRAFWHTRVYPKVSGLNPKWNVRLQKWTLVEKQHEVLRQQNSIDWLTK